MIYGMYLLGQAMEILTCTAKGFRYQIKQAAQFLVWVNFINIPFLKPLTNGLDGLRCIIIRPSKVTIFSVYKLKFWSEKTLCIETTIFPIHFLKFQILNLWSKYKYFFVCVTSQKNFIFYFPNPILSFLNT